MAYIEFKDSCVITRGGTKDAWDNVINPQVVYSGACNYQEAGSGYSRSIITRNPTVYLLGIPAEVRINDAIVVTTQFGRVIKSVVEIVRDVELPLTEKKYTKIELKQAKGD